MKKLRAVKLSLNRETLTVMSGGSFGGDDSCVQSCYLQSCGGSCGISTVAKQQQLCDQVR